MDIPSPPQPSARELHPLEVKVLLHASDGARLSQRRLVADLSYNAGQANQALSWLAAKGYVAESSRVTRVLYEITDFGRECLEKGTYEQRIVRLVASEGPLSLPGDRGQARDGGQGRGLGVRQPCQGRKPFRWTIEAGGARGATTRQKPSRRPPCPGGRRGRPGRGGPLPARTRACRLPGRKRGAAGKSLPARGAAGGDLHPDSRGRGSAPATGARRGHGRGSRRPHP